MARSAETCARCLQPIPREARRCPNCGTPRTNSRRIVVLLGIASLLALVFVILLMVQVVRNEDLQNQPISDSQSQDR